MSLLFALLTPFVGFCALLLISPSALRGIRYTSLAVSLLGFCFALAAFLGFDHQSPHYQYMLHQPWIGKFDIGFRIGVDGMSILFVLLTAITMPVVVLASFQTIHERQKHWYAMVLLLQCSVTGCFIALDTVLFYTFFELLLIPMYFMIGIWGGERKIYAALKFFIYTMFGSMLLLVALVWLSMHVQEQTGQFSTNWLVLQEFAPTLPLETQRWLFWAAVLAFGIKIPIFPLHTWLPDVLKEAPPAGAIVVGAVLFKIGVYGLIRFVLELFPAASFEYATVICWFAAVAVVYGGLLTIVQTDIKRMAAYALVCSLGVVVMGIFSMTPEGLQGAIIQTFNHGLSVAALFLCIGFVTERRKTSVLADFGGLARVMPVFTVLFSISIFSLVGLPGLNGFVGEYLLMLGTFRSPFLGTWIFGILAATAGTLAAVYLLKMLQKVCFGANERLENQELRDISPLEIAQLIPATLLMVWIGVYPASFMKYSEASTKLLISRLEVLRFGKTTVAGTVIQPLQPKTPVTAPVKSGGH